MTFIEQGIVCELLAFVSEEQVQEQDIWDAAKGIKFLTSPLNMHMRSIYISSNILLSYKFYQI
jgi:hypothetical protein